MYSSRIKRSAIGWGKPAAWRTSILLGVSWRLEARRPSQAGCLASGSRLRIETKKFHCRQRNAELFDLVREEIDLASRANHAVEAEHGLRDQTTPGGRKLL